MATRNKTQAYIRYRTSIKSHRPKASINENAGIVEMDKHDVSISLAPAWVDTVDEVRHYNITNIKKKMEDLSKLHSQHLLRIFDDRPEEQHEIEILTEEITRLFRDSEKKIKEIEFISSNKAEDDKRQEIIIKKNIQRTLASEVQELSIKFRKNQRDYLNRMRGKEASAKDLFSMDVGNKANNADANTSAYVDIDEPYDKGFSSDQVKLVDDQLAIIQQRDQQIDSILKSVNDLAEIFKDLSMLVIDQGTLLDRIDYNVEQVVQHVKKAHEELVVANTEQKKSRTKYCILLLLMMIFIVVILFVAL